MNASLASWLSKICMLMALAIAVSAFVIPSSSRESSSGMLSFTYTFYRLEKAVPYEVKIVPGLIPELNMSPIRVPNADLNNNYLTALLRATMSEKEVVLLNLESKRADEFVITFAAVNSDEAEKIKTKILKTLNVPFPNISKDLNVDLEKKVTQVKEYIKEHQKIKAEVEKAITEFGYSLTLIDKLEKVNEKIVALESSIMALEGNMRFLALNNMDPWEARLVAMSSDSNNFAKNSGKKFALVVIGLLLMFFMYGFLRNSVGVEGDAPNAAVAANLATVAALMKVLSPDVLQAYITKLRANTADPLFSGKKINFIHKEAGQESLTHATRDISLGSEVDRYAKYRFSEIESIEFSKEVQLLVSTHGLAEVVDINRAA